MREIAIYMFGFLSLVFFFRSFAAVAVLISLFTDESPRPPNIVQAMRCGVIGNKAAIDLILFNSGPSDPLVVEPGQLFGLFFGQDTDVQTFRFPASTRIIKPTEAALIRGEQLIDGPAEEWTSRVSGCQVNFSFGTLDYVFRDDILRAGATYEEFGPPRGGRIVEEEDR